VYRVRAERRGARGQAQVRDLRLQPPFFDPNADAAINYGAIGGVIGHELGHGFDDHGAKFDAKGVQRTWWRQGEINGRLTLGGELYFAPDQRVHVW
jgi:putative endopeptidase